jgi:predicted O-methyltransferase YrrM
VTQGLPKNLARLHRSFGRSDDQPVEPLLPGDSFTVEDVEFVCDYQAGSSADRFYIVKDLQHIRWYRDLFDRIQGAAIFELGIAEGGSTALTALLARPRKLVAIDNEEERLAALDQFIDARGLGSVVRPYWGVDQGDAERLREIADVELAGDHLDLVIDDASHQLHLTRSSFDTLFPYLRPGGLYVIEDWSNDHVFFDAVVAALKDPSAPWHAEATRSLQAAMAGPAEERLAKPEPLSTLGIELMLARASSGYAIDEVRFGPDSIQVIRGPAPLDSAFHLRDLYDDHFGLDPSGR